MAYIESNQALRHGKGFTYWYITDGEKTHHHKDDKWRKNCLVEVTTYWYSKRLKQHLQSSTAWRTSTIAILTKQRHGWRKTLRRSMLNGKSSMTSGTATNGKLLTKRFTFSCFRKHGTSTRLHTTRMDSPVLCNVDTQQTLLFHA